MFRTLIICMPLLMASAVAAADDAVAAEAAPHQDVAKKEHPKAQAPVKKEEPKAEEAAQDGAKAEGDVKMSGMSILGNEEAPKSLVIVPWKSSQLGDMPGISKLLDGSTQPVDKDVFMRELAYYQFRSNSK